MKREKEIELAMKEAVSETIVAAGWGMTPQATDLLECAFTKGAEWADKTMLDRACEWLSIYYPNIDRMGIDEFITAFRQAMKGDAE